LFGQSIKAYQELYDQATKVAPVKNEMMALNLGNQKIMWKDQGTSSEGVAPKKPAAAPSLPKSHPTGSLEPYKKCGRMNHATIECHMQTNRCIYCGNLDHLIFAYLRR